MDVDIEIDFVDASLLLSVTAPFMPRAVAQLRVFYLQQIESSR
jgi:hypothetical protein